MIWSSTTEAPAPPYNRYALADAPAPAPKPAPANRPTGTRGLVPVPPICWCTRCGRRKVAAVGPFAGVCAVCSREGRA